MEGVPLRLGDVVTTGRRRVIRGGLFGLAALAALVALGLLPFAGHSRGDHYVDTLTAASNIPLAMGIFIVVALVFAWRGRLRRTVLATPLSALAAVFASLVTTYHGSTQIKPISNEAESMVATAFTVCALLCVVVFVAEFILVANEPSRAPNDDELPEARLVSR